MPFWTPPRIWPDAVVAIIGGGPSIIGQDLTPIQGEGVRVIGVNNAFELGSWVDVCFFGDANWYPHNTKRLGGFSGLLVTNCESDRLDSIRRVRRVKRKNGFGIEENPRRGLRWNLNSGAAAINLAVWFGAKKVVLVGFDMGMKEGAPRYGHNWHNRHEGLLVPREHVYQSKFMKGFPKIKKDLDEMGVECVNATVGGNLDVFPREGLEEAVRGGKGRGDGNPA